MRTFATYIEYLLMTQHYCYVPGKGAYMLCDEPATMGTHPSIGTDSRRVHKLEAPRRVIRFSPLHHHDDGMLANLLMEAEGMSFDEACRYIERQSRLLPEDFEDNASLHIDTDNFGYNELSFETWGDIEARLNAAAHPEQHAPVAEKKQREADVIAIPRYWAQRVAVVLLIAVCFFASFLGLDDQTTQQQYANVIDLSILQRGNHSIQSWEGQYNYDLTEEEDSIYAGDELGDIYAYGSDDDEIWSDEEVAAFALNAEDVESEEEEITEAEAEVPALVAAPVAKTTVAPVAKTTAAPVAENTTKPAPAPETKKAITVAPNGKLYYIIVASCPNQQDANRALNNLRKQGHNEVGILERDDRFRLYINRFGDKTEAEAYLKVLREDNSFRSAWLLPVREASLSSIIKNTYDDNQLFMELSHLNQRTERDQG